VAVRVALLGGAAALVLEVAWFRALTLVFGSSVHALSLMLTAFLVGLVCGALVLARRGDAARDRAGLLARLHLLTAFAATLVTVLLQVVPALYIPVLRASGGTFGVVAAGSLLILLGVLVIPTTMMGASLPLAIRVGTGEDGGPSGPAGRVYGASSIGSSAGALVAGFVLVPWGGLRVACLVGVALSLGAAALLLPHTAGRAVRRQGWQVAALVAALWGIWLAGLLPWDWRILTAGYYAYGHLYSDHRAVGEGALERAVVLAEPAPFPAAGPVPTAPDPRAAGPATEERLLSWEEGTFAQVAVVEQGGIRSLLINGKADASNGAGDMRTQILLGHLPALLSPRPPGGEALVIGLGSGVTAGAVGQWPFARITVAEIEPAVVRASRWFEPENRGVMSDPRVALRVDDARRVLARSGGGLRMITSEPSNLWMAGVSLLFTREFFTLAADRLDRGGVLCQWLHLYQVGEDDVRTFLGTLADVFPHLLVFVDGSDMLVVAGAAPLELDPVAWQRRLATRPQVATALARVGITAAADLAAGIVADERGVGAWAAGAPRHTDDRPILEFSAARHMATDYSARIRSALVRAGVAAGPIPLGRVGAVTGPSTPTDPRPPG
jgi:spermidine synthase